MTKDEIARIRTYQSMPYPAMSLMQLDDYLALLRKLNKEIQKELTRLTQYIFAERKVHPWMRSTEPVEQSSP